MIKLTTPAPAANTHTLPREDNHSDREKIIAWRSEQMSTGSLQAFHAAELFLQQQASPSQALNLAHRNLSSLPDITLSSQVATVDFSGNPQLTHLPSGLFEKMQAGTLFCDRSLAGELRRVLASHPQKASFRVVISDEKNSADPISSLAASRPKRTITPPKRYQQEVEQPAAKKPKASPPPERQLRSNSDPLNVAKAYQNSLDRHWSEGRFAPKASIVNLLKAHAAEVRDHTLTGLSIRIATVLDKLPKEDFAALTRENIHSHFVAAQLYFSQKSCCEGLDIASRNKTLNSFVTDIGLFLEDEHPDSDFDQHDTRLMVDDERLEQAISDLDMKRHTR